MNKVSEPPKLAFLKDLGRSVALILARLIPILLLAIPMQWGLEDTLGRPVAAAIPAMEPFVSPILYSFSVLALTLVFIRRE
jgi:hypothetical protein